MNELINHPQAVGAAAVACSALLGIISHPLILLCFVSGLLLLYFESVYFVISTTTAWDRLRNRFLIFWLRGQILRLQFLKAATKLHKLYLCGTNQLRIGLIAFLRFLIFLLGRGDKLSKVVRFFVAGYFRIHRLMSVMPNVQNSAMPDV